MTNKERKIVTLPIEQIRPYKNNPRLNKKSVEILEQALQRYGFLIPITLDKDKVIVTGHSRFQAAINIGLKELPCIILDDLTDREIKEYRIADNRVAEHSFLDFLQKGAVLEEWAKEDNLIAKAFPTFAVDTTDFSKSKEERAQELPDLEVDNICMCPYCLTEFKVK